MVIGRQKPGNVNDNPNKGWDLSFQRKVSVCKFPKPDTKEAIAKKLNKNINKLVGPSTYNHVDPYLKIMETRNPTTVIKPGKNKSFLD